MGGCTFPKLAPSASSSHQLQVLYYCRCSLSCTLLSPVSIFRIYCLGVSSYWYLGRFCSLGNTSCNLFPDIFWSDFSMSFHFYCREKSYTSSALLLVLCPGYLHLFCLSKIVLNTLHRNVAVENYLVFLLHILEIRAKLISIKLDHYRHGIQKR